MVAPAVRHRQGASGVAPCPSPDRYVEKVLIPTLDDASDARHGEDHPSSPALSRRPPLVIIHPDAQQAVAELMQDMALTFQQCGSLENVEGFRATT